MIRITDAEFEIMQVIWEKNPISTNEIVEEMNGKKNWNMRTVHTLISRLEKKGAIKHTKTGRLYIYSPLVLKEDYIVSESRSFVRRFYDGAVSKMVMSFIDADIISDEDMAKLREMLDEREK